MIAAKAKNELPACPVETTLTLIGDKWKVLILRDLMPGTKRRTKKICGKCIAKSSDRTAPGDGGKRACPPRGLRRSTAESGVFADGTGQKPEAHSGFHAGLG